jgi:fructose-1,6-bisphosphatase/inositol monophosphatase family enzyme
MITEVSTLLRFAAAEAVMPRYRVLTAGEIEEKTPGEVVTVADRHAERIITAGLLAIRPGTRVVGEEACAADASLLADLGDGAIWLVDPLDGTGNFARGEGPFALMTALVVTGEPVAAWILDPIADVMYIAERGSGAFRNGERITVAPAPSGADALRGVVSARFMPSDLQAAMKDRMGALGEVMAPMMCAGAEYPDVATGERHFALYWRTLPWDHVPGALFLTEAGGHVARLDGSEYRIGKAGYGLLAARSRDVWQDVRKTLL